MKKIPKLIFKNPGNDSFNRLKIMKSSTIHFPEWVWVSNYKGGYRLHFGKQYTLPGGFFNYVSFNQPVILITKQNNLWKTGRLIFHEFSHWINWLFFKPFSVRLCRQADYLVDKILK